MLLLLLLQETCSIIAAVVPYHLEIRFCMLQCRESYGHGKTFSDAWRRLLSRAVSCGTAVTLSISLESRKNV